MASWQFDLHLIQKKRLVTLLGAYPITISQELLEQTTWWDENLAPDFLDADLSCFLPKAESWDPNLVIWGEENGNRVDVLYEDNLVVEVFVRIDLRQLDRSFPINLICLAKKHQCVFITTKMRVLEPTLNNLIKAMEESDAYRFVEDPTTFLDSLDSE